MLTREESELWMLAWAKGLSAMVMENDILPVGVDGFLPPHPHRAAVQWFLVMENDILPVGFGPALSTNHLLDLA